MFQNGMTIGALILAAGKSRRMGKPKAIVPFGEHPFLLALWHTIQEAGIEHILAVLGHQASEIISQLNLHSKQYVINHHYERGQFSSFQTGVLALAHKCDGIMLCLVDQPQISREVFLQLICKFVAAPERIVIPVCQGKRGHPVVFPRRLFDTILQAPPACKTSEVVHVHEDWISEVQVDDERILWNLNTQADLDALWKRFPDHSI